MPRPKLFWLPVRMDDSMTDRIEIWIPGQPARVTHQSGTRYANRRTYKTKALQEWERYLEASLKDFIPENPLEGPIELRVGFGFQAKRKKDVGAWKETKPDTDNSIKTLKDVMTRMGFWTDDAQVTYEVCRKFWTDSPGITIAVSSLTGRCYDLDFYSDVSDVQQRATERNYESCTQA